MNFLVSLHAEIVRAEREVQLEMNIPGEDFGNAEWMVNDVWGFDRAKLAALPIGKIRILRAKSGVKFNVMRVH